MTGHVPDASLPDLAEGGGSDAEREHAAACRPCAGRVEEARAALDLARRADVPEPSPLYWEAMRRSVGQRIAEEPRRAPLWAWLAPVAAAAAAVAVVVSTAGRPPVPPASPEPGLPAWSPLPAAEDDESLDLLESLAATGDEIGQLDEGRGVAAFLSGLSDEDYGVLVESLRDAGSGGES
jgi:hypothetical protein